jgi:hypothetical protein
MRKAAPHLHVVRGKWRRNELLFLKRENGEAQKKDEDISGSGSGLIEAGYSASSSARFAENALL